MTRADLPIGILLAVACLWVLWQATALPYGTEFAPGPGFFPLWLAIIGALLAAVIALSAWRTRGLPSPPEAGGRAGLGRAAAGAAGILAMILLIPALGLVLALLLYLLFLTLAVERLSIAVGVGTSVGTMLLVYLVFVQFLNVPFPRGPLGF